MRCPICRHAPMTKARVEITDQRNHVTLCDAHYCRHCGAAIPIDKKETQK